MTEQDNVSLYDATRTSIQAAIESGKLDKEAQAAPIAGALELARKMDHAMKGPSEQQLKLLLDYCKFLNLAPFGNVR